MTAPLASPRQLVEGFISEKRIPIRYIYKENGGLHTGYNTAYANIDSNSASASIQTTSCPTMPWS